MSTKQIEVQIPAAVFNHWTESGLMDMTAVTALKGRAVIFNVEQSKIADLIGDCQTQLGNKADLREPYRRALKLTIQRLTEAG